MQEVSNLLTRQKKHHPPKKPKKTPKKQKPSNKTHIQTPKQPKKKHPKKLWQQQHYKLLRTYQFENEQDWILRRQKFPESDYSKYLQKSYTNRQGEVHLAHRLPQLLKETNTVLILVWFPVCSYSCEQLQF